MPRPSTRPSGVSIARQQDSHKRSRQGMPRESKRRRVCRTICPQRKMLRLTSPAAPRRPELSQSRSFDLDRHSKTSGAPSSNSSHRPFGHYKEHWHRVLLSGRATERPDQSRFPILTRSSLTRRHWRALSHCRIECVTAFGSVMHHAAATASRHVFIAVALKARCVVAEVRWRWT